MTASFGVGVLVASHSELFPPQVEGESSIAAPGGRTPSPVVDERWRARVTTGSRQEYSAGACVTDWRSSIDLVVGSDGSVRGTGRSQLRGLPRCPFPTSQPQVEGYGFEVRGRYDASTGFRLSLSHFRATRGIFDYGGFALTMADAASILAIPVEGNRGHARIESRTFTNLGKVVRAKSVVRIDCHSCSRA